MLIVYSVSAYPVSRAQPRAALYPNKRVCVVSVESVHLVDTDIYNRATLLDLSSGSVYWCYITSLRVNADLIAQCGS